MMKPIEGLTQAQVAPVFNFVSLTGRICLKEATFVVYFEQVGDLVELVADHLLIELLIWLQMD